MFCVLAPEEDGSVGSEGGWKPHCRKWMSAAVRASLPPNPEAFWATSPLPSEAEGRGSGRMNCGCVRALL